jgi:hypothetical protein
LSAPSKDDIKELRNWLTTNKKALPVAVANTLESMLELYLGMSQSSAKSKQMLARLREAMGIVPKSERGKTDNLNKAVDQNLEMDLSKMSPEEREHFEKIKAKRSSVLSEAARYSRELKQLRLRPKNAEQLEFELADAYEMVFSQAPSGRQSEELKKSVERMKNLGTEKGLHSTFDSTKRIDLQILVTDINCKVETVTDPRTGKSVRASMDDVGPAGSTMTWRAITNLIKLTVGFAIPINRVALIIGQSEFSSGKICRVLRMVADLLLPIYLHLAEQLSDGGIMSGDDTKTKVLNLSHDDAESSLAKQVDDHLEFRWQKADGSGEKKALNVSLIVGRSHALDPRSTIRFFRTHLGSVGNLLTRLLEWRSPKSGPLIFQGDLSSTNLPSAELRKKFKLILAGCGAHARRPFWRYREEDGLLCYFMLRGFLSLAKIEGLVDAKGRTKANVLRYRGRYSRRVWQALRNRCLLSTGAAAPGARFTLRKDAFTPDIWPPGTELHRACMYVINHFEELTLYLDNPFLKYTNNGSERALRIEKCFLSSSKFTKTRDGRAVTDILRTINATCTAAGLDLSDYLQYVFKNRSQLHKHPELFTPYAVVLALEKEKTKNQPQR